MAVIQVAVVDENGNPRRGVTVAAYDLTNFPAIQTTGMTDEAGTVTLTVTSPAFVDAFDRRGVSFRDRSYEGKIQIQIISFGNLMNADYVVDSNGFGTHLTLFGATGAFEDSVNDAASRFIWVCTTHEESVTATTTLSTLATGQTITIMSGSPTRAVIDMGTTLTSFNGPVFTQAATQPSDSRIRFENIGFRAFNSTNIDFYRLTGGTFAAPMDMIAVEFLRAGGSTWRYFLDLSGTGSGVSRGVMWDRVRGDINSIVNLAGTGTATGPFILENCDLTLTHLVNRNASTEYEAGNRYLISNNRLTFSGYSLQVTHGQVVPSVITGNYIQSSFTGVAFLFGTAGTTNVRDVAFTGNFMECTSNNAATRAIRIGTAAATTSGSNVVIQANALLGPGSAATAIELVATLTDSIIENGYRNWGTNLALNNGATTIPISSWQSGHAISYDETRPTVLMASMHQTNTTDNVQAVGLFAHGATAGIGGSLFLGRSRGTQAAPTIVASGDSIGRITFAAHDGENLVDGASGISYRDYEPGARIEAVVDATPGADDMPTRLVFYTSADAASVLTERLRLVSTGGAYFSNHARVGSATAPTNVTDGDLTVVRLKVVDGAFGTGVDFSVTGDGALSGFLRVGSETAPVNTTAGDLTSTRLAVGNTALASGTTPGTSAGYVANLDGTVVAESAEATAAVRALITFAPAANSSSEQRAFYFLQLLTAATATYNIVTGGFYENRMRQGGTVAEAGGFIARAVALDSSSPATVGTVTLAYGVQPEVYRRPSGARSVTITTGVGLYLRTGRVVGDAGATFTDLYNIKIEDQSTNTIGTFYGIAQAKLTRGTTNIEYITAGKMVYTPTSQTLAAAGNTIGSTARLQDVDNSTGASLTLTSTPTVAAGVSDGQLLTITNVDSADNIVLQDETALAGSTLRLPGAANLTLGPRDSVTLRWRAAASEWWTFASSNN